MQLLFKREQSTSRFGRPRFELWARVELTSEEDQLINTYQVRRAILSEGDPRRDLIRSAKYTAALSPVAYLLLASIFGVVNAFLLTIVAFAVGTYLIYQQIREEIRVADIIAGRFFTCPSVLALIAKERMLTEMAVIFRQFIEAMKTWGGAEVIHIEPDQKPVVELTQPRAAA